MTKGFDAGGLERLDAEECWRFLARHFLGRVGLVHFGQPMIFPVNYVLDGDSVVFRTAPGTKLALAGLGAQVAFEVDEATQLFETGTSVVVHGSLREVTDREEIARLERLALHTWAPGERDHFMRIEPGSLTGRRIPIRASDDDLR